MSMFNLHHIFGSNTASTSLCMTIAIKSETMVPYLCSGLHMQYSWNASPLKIIWYNYEVRYRNERNECHAISEDMGYQ